MDAKQTGRFIADLRKEKGLTQEELAQKLNVTNKAVSRWETGAGFPDVDSMMALSEFLDVSINELLLGRRNAPSEQADEAAAEELKRKEEAQIACESLDISVKRRRLKRLAVCLSVLLVVCTVLAAVLPLKPARTRNKVEAAEKERWFSPLSLPETTGRDVPARVIDLKTGRGWAACSVPGCEHARNDEECFFNWSAERTEVYAAEYLDNRIFFIARKRTGEGDLMKLYGYSMETGETEELYSYHLIDVKARLFSNHSTLFFTVLERVDAGRRLVSLRAYDPKSGSITILENDADALENEPDNAVFLDDCYIRFDHSDGETERLFYRRRSYDGYEDTLFSELPDGTPLELFGYSLHNGLFSNPYTGGVYDRETGRCIELPAERDNDLPKVYQIITPPVLYGDSYYYQTRRGDVINNDIRIVKKDGSFTCFTTDCPYHFTVLRAYGNIVFGKVMYRELDNGRRADYSEDGKYIRIDLDTGETSLYDILRRNDPVYKTFVTAVSMYEEKEEL